MNGKLIGIYTRTDKSGVKKITIREATTAFVDVSEMMAKVAKHRSYKATVHESFKEARGALMNKHGVEWFNRGRKHLADFEKRYASGETSAKVEIAIES